MPEKTLKHFVLIRFFTHQASRYPYDIFDVDFLQMQLSLAQNNVLKSLENQTNKNFEIIFIANDKYFFDSKYEFIFSTLRNSTTLPLKFIKVHQLEDKAKYLLKQSELTELIKDAYNKYDFVIQSAIDFDDFIYKDAVADTQSKINSCNGILGYGYCRGYTYINGELYKYGLLCKGRGHHSIFQSLIWKSSFAKNLELIGLHSFQHTKFKIVIENFLKENGIAFMENMFEQNKSTRAYIYFRHEFSREHTKKWGTADLKSPKRLPLTTADITKGQLASEFGFHYDLKSIK